MTIDYYEQGREFADKIVHPSMMNFEEEDDYACLSFSAKKLIEMGFEQYEEVFSFYEKKSMGEFKYATDPHLSEKNEDRLLGFCARALEIKKLNSEGYFYHRIKDPSKRGGWDYSLEILQQKKEKKDSKNGSINFKK